jgi:nucleoid-associated protein YgaU
MVKNGDASERTTARLYRVQEDDDLRSIAERIYGAAEFWVFLYDANVKAITKSGGLRPGQVLFLPEL